METPTPGKATTKARAVMGAAVANNVRARKAKKKRFMKTSVARGRRVTARARGLSPGLAARFPPASLGNKTAAKASQPVRGPTLYLLMTLFISIAPGFRNVTLGS